jgi:signal transduction histidine kinase
MLSSLRWKLTFLYLLAAIGLVGLMGIGTYLLIDRYFQQTTDLALQYKMASEFRILGLTTPTELAQAESTWLQNNSRAVLQATPTTRVPTDDKESGSHGDDRESDSDDDDDDSDESDSEEYLENDHGYDADLAAIFVVSLDENGNPILIPNTISPPIVNDPTIVANALQAGYDLRTVEVPGKGRIRLLTYRTGTKVPALLQAGRLLADQVRALNQYLVFLAILGSSATIFLVFVSWWLAGRSLGPAQKAWDQQQTFVSNASHELRTPLTLIRATADYGLRSQPKGEQSQLLTDILNECDYMDHLVDDLLLLSRLDAHRLKMELEPVAVSDLFSETVRQVSKLAQAGNISIETGSASGLVRADRVRLRQVLLILLDNALRFTPSGGSIRLSAHPAGKWMQIEVADSGRGIDPKHLPHLFDRFYQVAAPENDASRSNGLGLSIAKRLIEAQGGSIHIVSSPGKGTHVQVSLPIASHQVRSANRSEE